MGQRLGTCGRELAPEKTRGLPCTRQQAPGPTRVDVLGFEVRWGRDWAGKPHRTRRTARQKRRNARTRGTDWGQEKCRYRLKDLFREVHAKWRGYDRD